MTEYNVRFYTYIGKYFDTPFNSLDDANSYFNALKYNMFVSKVELIQIKKTIILQYPE